MKTIKVSELTGAALDWAVAQIESGAGPDKAEKQWRYFGRVFHPSTDWAQGGVIIEREGINLFQRKGLAAKVGKPWLAYNEKQMEAAGLTLLIAAMRCYVASKIGDTFEVPEELL